MERCTITHDAAEKHSASSAILTGLRVQQDFRWSPPALALGRGAFVPAGHQPIFGSIGDSAPDAWGRRLMQRAERRVAERDGHAPHTLQELDYLLGVSDVSRLGALRFRKAGEEAFRSPAARGVPKPVDLGRLLGITERILREEETDEDLQMIFAPGSSLGGARPKASVVDQPGRLSIGKFPKEIDEYSIELWEFVALSLANQAGVRTPVNELLSVAGKPVLLSKRFDRANAKVTEKWRQVAVAAGASNAEIQRMESAFEHEDLRRALAL